MLRFGGPLLAAALGIALEVSDVHSRPVQIGAWGAVVLGTFVLMTGSFAAARSCVLRRHSARKRRRRRGGGGLAAELVRLGNRILTFKHDRDAQAPRPKRAPFSMRHPVQTARARQAHAVALAGHEADTLSLYDRRFSGDVRAAVSKLLDRGALGHNQAQELLGPETAAMIEAVGLQLVELGKRHGRRSMQAA